MTPPPAHPGDPDPPPGSGSTDRGWASFAAFLDQHTLNTALLQRWLGGAEVHISSLTATGAPEQERTLTLSARIGGGAVVVCQASSTVHLDRLPAWARTVLTSTQLPLGHTLSRVGAVRDRSTPILLQPSADPAEPSFTVNGTFRLAGDPVAEVTESFTGHVLEHAAPMSEAAIAAGRAADLLDEVDVALVGLLRRRVAAQQAARTRLGAPPPVYALHDDLLRAQLRDEFGGERGGALSAAITAAGGTRPAEIAAAAAARRVGAAT